MFKGVYHVNRCTYTDEINDGLNVKSNIMQEKRIQVHYNILWELFFGGGSWITLEVKLFLMKNSI